MEINRKKLIYAILREVNNNSDIKYTHDIFGVDKQIFEESLLIIHEENLAKGIAIKNYDNQTHPFVFNKMRITLAGIEFLEANNPYKKTYKGLKEIREWLPF